MFRVASVFVYNFILQLVVYIYIYVCVCVCVCVYVCISLRDLYPTANYIFPLPNRFSHLPPTALVYILADIRHGAPAIFPLPLLPTPRKRSGKL